MTHGITLKNSILIIKYVNTDAPPNSLMDSTLSPKVKTTEGRVRAHFMACNILGVEGHAEALG
jgi:hypothetical protein